MNPFKVGTLRLYYAPRPPQDAAAAELAAPDPSGAAEPRPGDAHTSGVGPGMTRDGHPDVGTPQAPRSWTARPRPTKHPWNQTTRRRHRPARPRREISDSY